MPLFLLYLSSFHHTHTLSLSLSLYMHIFSLSPSPKMGRIFAKKLSSLRCVRKGNRNEAAAAVARRLRYCFRLARCRRLFLARALGRPRKGFKDEWNWKGVRQNFSFYRIKSSEDHVHQLNIPDKRLGVPLREQPSLVYYSSLKYKGLRECQIHVNMYLLKSECLIHAAFAMLPAPLARKLQDGTV